MVPGVNQTSAGRQRALPVSGGREGLHGAAAADHDVPLRAGQVEMRGAPAQPVGGRASRRRSDARRRRRRQSWKVTTGAPGSRRHGPRPHRNRFLRPSDARPPPDTGQGNRARGTRAGCRTPGCGGEGDGRVREPLSVAGCETGTVPSQRRIGRSRTATDVLLTAGTRKGLFIGRRRGGTWEITGPHFNARRRSTRWPWTPGGHSRESSSAGTARTGDRPSSTRMIWVRPGSSHGSPR